MARIFPAPPRKVKLVHDRRQGHGKVADGASESHLPSHRYLADVLYPWERRLPGGVIRAGKMPALPGRHSVNAFAVALRPASVPRSIDSDHNAREHIDTGANKPIWSVPPMGSLWASFLRFVSRLGQLLAVAFTLATFLGILALYLAVAGTNLQFLHAVVRTLGEPFAAQRTEHIDVSAQVFPDSHRLSATATLTLRSMEERRRRFFFLLNPLLQLRSVKSEASADPDALSVYRLSWITIVEPKHPVAKDQTLTLTFDYEGVFPSNPPDPIATTIDTHSVLLGADAFWYPTDAQSFFTADVHVTLPGTMTLVHSSSTATRVERGDLQVVHWSSTRPIAAIPIIAGTFALTEHQAGKTNYRLYLAAGIALDADRILEHMARADRFLSERFGPSGFDTVSVYVNRDLRRGVNYGCGLIGLSLRYFRGGDDGYALLAHEIAHNWWGATVAEQWLRPGTGGQWIVEGLAEFSSLMATEDAFGVDALTRRLASEFFDPARQRAIRDMSMLDNVLTEAITRDTIYRKGSYTAFRLCSQIGREPCFAALHQFVDKYRYQQASDEDLQKVFEAVAGHSLSDWFADWVRSDSMADLKLVGDAAGQLTVQSDGKARVASELLPLWVFRDDDSEPTVTAVHVGDKLGLQTGQYAILDPQLLFPDVVRRNNRYPASADPLYVAAASADKLLITTGEPWPWSAQTITRRDAGATKQTWELPRATLQPPAWFPDGAQVLISYSDPDQPLPTILALAADGTRRSLGRGTSPALASDGSVYAARKDRIVRIAADGSESIAAQRSGWVVDQPLPSPDLKRLAYLAARHNDLELRLAAIDGGSDRVLFSTDRDRTLLRWAPGSDKLYALVGGDWDWRIVEIPVEDKATRILVRDAAAIGDFAVSPDGSRIALTAAPEPGCPIARKRLYILTLDGQATREIEVPDTDLDSVSWDGNDTLLVVGARVSPGRSWVLPQSRTAKIVSLRDGSARDLP